MGLLLPNPRQMPIMEVMEVTTAMGTAMVSMVMATVTNSNGPHTVLPVSHPLFGSPVARGPLSLQLNPMDTDSTVTILMLMAFTILMPMDIMSLMSLHLPSLPLLLLVLVLEVIPVVPLLILTEALKVFVARGLPKKLPLLKMIKFTEPDTTAMLDKPSGDSPRLRGLPKK